MSSSLFRAEVVARHGSPQWLGSIRLVRPPSLAWLTAAIVAAAVAAGSWLWIGEYTRKAQVAGVLLPDLGLIRLVAPAAGTVLERRAAEGRPVQAGDVLFVVGLARTTLDGAAQAEVRRSLDERRRSLQEAARQQAALGDAQRDALARRLRELQREQEQLDAEAALHAQRLALAREAHARLQSLASSNFISPAQVQAKSEELLALQVQGRGIERQRATLVRERAEVEGEWRAMPLRERGRLGELERELAALAREAAETEAQRRLEVRTPHSGTVTALAMDAGQAVAAGAELAALVPSGARLQAHLFAPSGAIGQVQVDQAVRLRLDAFPHQQFGVLQGRVLQVARTPLRGADNAEGPAGPTGRTEPLFRITVAIDPAPDWAARLTPGMRLEADVMLERRRLVEWLFAPVRGLAQRSG
jgi:membrane fusion protein